MKFSCKFETGTLGFQEILRVYFKPKFVQKNTL